MSFEVSMTITRPSLNPGYLNRAIDGTSGEVGKHMRKIGRRILLAARRQVGKDTGALKASIVMIHGRNGGVGDGQFVKIIATAPHALMHHNGTRPHLIVPKGHQFLRFSSGGRIIYTRKVRHPGTRPNKYLSDNLKLVLV